jgi:hypothetical protein
MGSGLRHSPEYRSENGQTGAGQICDGSLGAGAEEKCQKMETCLHRR